MGPPVAVAAVIAANAAVAVSLWLQNGLGDVGDLPTVLVSAGRLTGLLGAYFALVQLALLSRLPALERAAALDRRIAWHRPAASPASGCCAPTRSSSPRATRSATASDCRRRSDGS